MTISRSLPCLSALGVLAACTQDLPGTQVGIEDSFSCEEVSSEVLSDLDAVPDDLGTSPADLLADATGTFAGDQLDEDEAPTGASAALTVADPGGDVHLVRYEASASHDGGEDDLSHLCTPRLVLDLDYRFEADGLPAYAATLETWIDPDGAVRAGSDDEAGFAAPLPEPTTFDPDAFDNLVPRTLFSGADGTWWATVAWVAWSSDEVESDGDVPLTDEVLVHARLEGAAE